MATAQLRQFDELHRLVTRSPCRLQDLITAVERQAGDDPLHRLTAASALAADLAHTADGLLGHFVDSARRSGQPWSRIGVALGVTRQAVQQRFVEPDLTRFTDGARRAVTLAGEAARRRDRPATELEHLLLGLSAVPRSVAATVLVAAGASPDVIEGHLGEPRIGRAESPGDQAAAVPPLAPKAGRLLSEGAPGEAATLGHNYVGTEHVLLALLRRPGAVVGTILSALAVTADPLREQVLQVMLTGAGTGRVED